MDGMRLKGAKELKETFIRLTTEKVESSGFTGPQRDFVTKEAWDPKLDGKWDDAKATTKTIFGRKEVWYVGAPRPGGRVQAWKQG